MKFIKIVALILILIIALLCVAYRYYLYTPITKVPALPGVWTNDTVTVDSRRRHYSVYRPATHLSKPAVVFVLHGSNGNGNKVRQQSGFQFDLLAEESGALIVYPNGIEGHWNDCRALASYSANKLNINDPAFFDVIIEKLIKDLDIDRARVFAAGFSNGGQMAFRLGLERPNKFRGIAAISANMPVAENSDCEPSGQAISVAIFNGDLDPINPYNGGSVEIYGETSRGAVTSSLESADYWAKLAGPMQSTQTIEHDEIDGDPDTAVRQQRWTTADGKQIRLYQFAGSGHVIPFAGAHFPRVRGPVGRDLSAPRQIIEFFEAI
jgi:polyhydroxybutyrate depolymerase